MRLFIIFKLSAKLALIAYPLMPAFALKLIVESSINTSEALETEIPN